MNPYANLIGGRWITSTAIISNISPSDTNDVVGEYSMATPNDVAEAGIAARASLKSWSQSTAQARAEILLTVARELEARRVDLGELLAREEGKTRADGIGEVARAAQVFQFFAGEALRLQGERAPSIRPGVEVEITREPVGVVGIITPWNFPIAIPAWKIAPALAFGNTVIFKPAELTPASAWALTDILHRAGTPPGVVNLVMGRGSQLGEAIIHEVDAMSFTGSVPTGRRIAARAIESMVKLQLEMGGKNPLIVLDDADLDIAVDCAVNGAFYQTGQRCTATSRIIVQKGIHDRFVASVVERMRSLRVGHALDSATDIGPVVDQRQFDSNLQYLEVGEGEGAARIGGQVLQASTPGFYLQPALFTETNNSMRINREEIFGPIASIIPVDSFDEALDVANDTAFGLSAGICTTSLKYARHFQANIQSGLAMVNLPTAGLDFHVPFGGRKASSYGPREQGRYAAEFYTTVKTSYVRP